MSSKQLGFVYLKVSELAQRQECLWGLPPSPNFPPSPGVTPQGASTLFAACCLPVLVTLRSPSREDAHLHPALVLLPGGKFI